LACYYAQELTLAETGTLLGEHEATCSRQLARTRKTLRVDIERHLRNEHALTTAEIADCFAAVSQDPGELDVRQLLRIEIASTEREARSRGRKEPRDDRSTVRGRTGTVSTRKHWRRGSMGAPREQCSRRRQATS